jgi:hypothetical protein
MGNDTLGKNRRSDPTGRTRLYRCVFRYRVPYFRVRSSSLYRQANGHARTNSSLIEGDVRTSLSCAVLCLQAILLEPHPSILEVWI